MRNVNDERVKRRPLLGLEKLRDGRGIERIGGEAVNSLRGQRDDLSTAKQTHCFLDGMVEERWLVGG